MTEEGRWSRDIVSERKRSQGVRKVERVSQKE